MKRTYFHGTSADNLDSILSGGLKCDTEKVWNCSQDEIYLWCVDAVGKADDIDDEEYKIERTRQMAIESAQIACATAKDCRCVVLQIQLDDSEIMADNSCKNMEGSGAVCIGRDIELNEIVSIQVSNDLSLIKGYFMCLLLDREYINLELSKMELKIAEGFKKAELYPEDIDEMVELQEVKMPLQKKQTKKLATSK